MGIKIPWQVWACLGLILILCGSNWYSYAHGKSVVRKEWNAAIERGNGIVAGLKQSQNTVTTEVKTVYVDRIKVVHEKGDTITKLVPQYIPLGTPDLPFGFRVLFDAAATNTVPTTPFGANGPSTSVEDVATTTSENFETYHKVATELEGLQSWAAKQHENYLALCKQPGVTCSKDK